MELFVQRKDFVCGTGRDGRPREPTRWNIALLGLRVAEGLADVHQHLRGGAARAVAGALRHHEVSNREKKKKTSSSLTANKPPTTTTSRHLKSDIVTVGFGGVMGMAAFLMCSGESSAPTSRTPFSFLCVCVCVCVFGPWTYGVPCCFEADLSLSLFPKRTCVCVCVEQNNQAPRARGFRWPTPGS